MIQLIVLLGEIQVDCGRGALGLGYGTGRRGPWTGAAQSQALLGPRRQAAWDRGPTGSGRGAVITAGGRQNP